MVRAQAPRQLPVSREAPRRGQWGVGCEAKERRGEVEPVEVERGSGRWPGAAAVEEAAVEDPSVVV